MIPLHIKPDDMSPEACRARCLLHIQMAALNPKGWRTPRSQVKARSKLRIGRRHLRNKPPQYRLDNLAQLAVLAGKAGLLERIKRKSA